MFICIKCGKDFNFVADIKLKDGHEPFIGKTRLGEKLQIEPAIWFKIFVIDTLWIDCSARQVRWSRKRQTSVGKESKDPGEPGFYDASLQDSMAEGNSFEDGELYDYDSTIDEFFVEMLELIETYGKDYIVHTLFCQSLLRMLHCYLLPKVILTKEDEQQLVRSVGALDEHVVECEKAICAASNHVTLINNSLVSQRQRFIDNLQCDSNVGQYSVEFLEKLSKHVDADICLTLNNLKKSQDEINDLRDSDEGMSGKANTVELMELRLVRDDIHKKSEGLIFVRENIRNMALRSLKKKNSVRKKTKKPSPVGFESAEDRYMLVCKLFEEREEELRQLCEKKLKIVSIKEAMKSALSDLQLDDETLGIDIGIQKATDILQINSKPETWVTLEEVVMSMLSRTTAFSQRHLKFCNLVCDTVSAFLDEQSYFGTPEVVSNGDSDTKRTSYKGLFGETIFATEDLNANEHDAVKTVLYTVSSIRLPDGGLADVKPDKNIAAKGKSEVLSPLLECMGRLAQVRRMHSHSSLESPSMEWELLTFPVKQRINQLRGNINDHIENTILLLQEELGNPMTLHYNKLWVYYESHLYPNIMSSLTQLYRFAYKPVYETLARIPGLLPQDLDVMDPWIINLFTVASRQSLESPREGQGHSIKRKFLTRVSGTDRSKPTTEDNRRTELSIKDIGALYKFADSECRAMSDTVSYMTSLLDVSLEPDEKTPFKVSSDMSVRRSSSDPTIHDKRTPPVTLPKNVDSPSDPSQQNSMTNTSSSADTELKTRPPTERSRSSKEAEATFSDLFAPVISKIATVSREQSILAKMKQLTKAFRMISKRVADLHNNGNYLACCDDMLTVCIVLMTRLTTEQLFALYTDVNMMIDLMAPCLRGGIHDCALMNFQGAFQYIIDYLTMKYRRDNEVVLRK